MYGYGFANTTCVAPIESLQIVDADNAATVMKFAG